MRTIVPIAITLLLLGCDSRTPTTPSNKSATQSAKSTDEAGHESVVARSADKSFGIANGFSGKLSDEQERMVPEALRGAFTIESLRQITASELEKELKLKMKVAEEIRGGNRYVALKDFRHVQFSDDLSGQMIVVERYAVTPH